MKRNLTLLFVLLTCCWGLSAQPSGYTQQTGTAQTSLIKNITSAASNLNTLKVNFTQEKKSKSFSNPAVSQGTMSYKKSNQLCWAYTSPRAYSIILNSKGAFLKTAKGSTKNKMIGEMATLILRTINGEGLTNNSDFNLTYYKGKDVLVYLTPKSKRFQEMYKCIEVYLNPQTYLATSVKMIEKNGDVTVIKFTNHQKNITLPTTEFQE